MKFERIDVRPGDKIRVPDRATARWHTVVRVGRRRDGTRYITLRQSRIGRLLGLPASQRLEWGSVKALGYGLKRARAANQEEPELPLLENDEVQA